MLGNNGARVSKTKTAEVLPQILTGAVCKQLKTCGKVNCRCARGGQKHVQYCRFYRANGRLKKQYVKFADLETVRAACAAHRAQRREQAAANGAWRFLLAQLKAYERMYERSE